MTWVEAVVEAFRLFVLTVSYAIDLAKKHADEVADAKQKRVMFEAAVALAMSNLRARAGEEKRQVDSVDDQIDNK